MITYKKRLQALFQEYQEYIGKPCALRDAIDWGLKSGKITLPKIDPVAVLVSDLKDSLRGETRTDAQGNEYRAYAAVTFSSDGSAQQSFWGDIDQKTTPHEFVVEHFAQRRKGIVDDNVKLKADVDHYNGTLADKGKWIQLVLDYTDDVAEREAMRDAEREDAA